MTQVENDLPIPADLSPVVTLRVDSVAVGPSSTFTVPVRADRDLSTLGITSYRFALGFLTQKITFLGFSTEGTASEDFDVMVHPMELGDVGMIMVEASGKALLNDARPLLNLTFRSGSTPDRTAISFDDMMLPAGFNDGDPAVFTSSGTVLIDPVVRSVVVARPAGWSLTSLPVQLDGVPLDSLFASLEGAFLFEPDQGYVQTDRPAPTQGFWLNLGMAERSTLFGDLVGSYERTFDAGWQLSVFIG